MCTSKNSNEALPSLGAQPQPKTDSIHCNLYRERGFANIRVSQERYHEPTCLHISSASAAEAAYSKTYTATACVLN